MDILLGVLDQLKINNSIWLQLACFLVTYFFISNLLIKPYFQAYLNRQSRTVGNQELAIKTAEEAEAEFAKYQERARAINLEVKNIFDNARKTAVVEQDQLMSTARGTSQKKIDAGRAEIIKETTRARQEILNEVGEISQLIRVKMLGRETTN